MIPKKIHYCWFGKNEMPDKLKKCIDSWKRYMPDYEFIKWDENNYDINKCNYIKEAYEEKKWAFVSDYVRLDVCYTYGGIYIDTDVEVLKSFDDLLNLDGFCGMEIGKKKVPNEVNTGLVLGMKKGLKIGKLLRDDYNNLKFKNEDGSLNTTPCTLIQTKMLRNFGLKLNNKVQIIKGLTIFPTEYFCPMNQYTGEMKITKNTYSIHHYYGSWITPEDKLRRELRIKYSKYGNLNSNILSTFMAYKKYYGLVFMWIEIFKKIKNKIGGNL